MSDVARVASWLREAHAVAVITGARISAESGVPTFRGTDGETELPTCSSCGAVLRPAIEAAQ